MHMTKALAADGVIDGEVHPIMKRWEPTAVATPEFAHLIGHALRQPLAAICSFAELLQDGIAGPITSEQSEHVATILRNTNTLARLAAWVPDALLMASGKLVPEIERVAIDRLLTVVRESLAEELSRFRVRLSILSVETTDAVEPIQSDRRRLESALFELIASCVRRAQPGDEVTLQVRRRGRVACFEVGNRASGLAPRDLQRLLARHHGSDDTEAAVFDTELGLILARHVVHAMDGTIRTAGNPTDGVRFTLELPWIRGDRANIDL